MHTRYKRPKGRNATSATILKYGSKDVPTSAKLFVSTMISQIAHIEHVHYYLIIYCITYVSTVECNIYIYYYIQISCIYGYTMIYIYIYIQEVQVQRLLKKKQFPHVRRFCGTCHANHDRHACHTYHPAFPSATSFQIIFVALF